MPEEDRPVRILGYDSTDGTLDIFVIPRVPDPVRDGCPATERQLQAVKKLFPHIDVELTGNQCNALLSYRNYARAFVDRLGIVNMRETWTILVIAIVFGMKILQTQ
ncbi:MAG: hypothetical protein ACFBQW_07675 [Sphingomonadaceae bacterium]